MCFALGVPTISRFTRKCFLDNSCPDTKCSLLHGFALLAVRGEVILTPSPPTADPWKVCSTHYVHQDPSGFLLKRLLFRHSQAKLSGWGRIGLRKAYFKHVLQVTLKCTVVGEPLHKFLFSFGKSFKIFMEETIPGSPEKRGLTCSHPFPHQGFNACVHLAKCNFGPY